MITMPTTAIIPTGSSHEGILDIVDLVGVVVGVDGANLLASDKFAKVVR